MAGHWWWRQPFLIQFALILGGFIFLSDYSFVLYGLFYYYQRQCGDLLI